MLRVFMGGGDRVPSGDPLLRSSFASYSLNKIYTYEIPRENSTRQLNYEKTEHNHQITSLN